MASHEKQDSDPSPDVIMIKKYANRRLYNTDTSSYVTLDYLAEMVRRNEEFVVTDAKTGADITRSVLTQIIFEEESKGQNLLPVNFLRKLIKYYGDNLQSFVPPYLELSMETFQKNHEAMRESMLGVIPGNPGLKVFEDVARQNMAMFEQGMKMFGVSGASSFANPWSAMTPAQEKKSTDHDAEIAALREEIDALKTRLSEKE